METNILEIKNLSKSFYRPIINLRGKKDQEITYLLKGLDLPVKKGVVSALIGGNGTGKSTLFNLIGGYIRPNRGSIKYSPEGSKSYELTRLPAWRANRLGIGRMFQGPHVFRDLTVLENMLVADENAQGEMPFANLFRPGLTRRNEALRTEEAKARLDDLLGPGNPIWEKRAHKAGSLSYGQQRLLAMARIFMNNSLQLILLDEPGAGVNPDIIERMKEILLRLRESGRSVLLIEHNLPFVRAVADETHYLANGRVLHSGPTAEVFEQEEIRNTFLKNH